MVGDDVYGGTFRYLERVHRAQGVDARYVDLAAGQDALWEALTERTRLVWFETPSNPLLKVVDIAAAVATVARRSSEGGRRPLVVVDNTFASPALQRPLQLGADISFHSATKYLAGHSDTIVGVAATSDPDVAERLRFLQNAMGAVPGPLDCFLVLRGLRTLHLRMERHGSNAVEVAAFLGARSDVAEVSYPGFGGMVSFLPAAGGRHDRSAAERAIAVAEATRLFTLAESLGGVESLIEVPAAMTHMSVAGSPLEVSAELVRLVGRDRERSRPDRGPDPGARPRLSRAARAASLDARPVPQPPAIAGSRTRVSRIADGRFERLEMPDVGVVQERVDEPVQVAVRPDQLRLEPGVCRHQPGHDFTDRAARDLDLAGAAGGDAQGRRDP